MRATSDEKQEGLKDTRHEVHSNERLHTAVDFSITQQKGTEGNINVIDMHLGRN